MTKLEITKAAAKFIVGAGTSKIVSSIIQNNVSPETLTEKVTITAGSIALGSMVADITSKYTDAKIDEIAAWWKNHVNN